eukprot:CAMPEP_0115855464 /NCGR_PEP_ID=MMETSP0287-20121206/14554_1 /TAXON_ID=412157 /ORGANISM="Chrysochromulina rotalis, Strain UIO044" /LENGTH=244 /DNA_ID=CAMNT_0003309615 /DNA_START=732 /DNA_END=1467 /DNA_ORIENTATION=-
MVLKRLARAAHASEQSRMVSICGEGNPLEPGQIAESHAQTEARVVQQFCKRWQPILLHDYRHAFEMESLGQAWREGRESTTDGAEFRLADALHILARVEQRPHKAISVGLMPAQQLLAALAKLICAGVEQVAVRPPPVRSSCRERPGAGYTRPVQVGRGYGDILVCFEAWDGWRCFRRTDGWKVLQRAAPGCQIDGHLAIADHMVAQEVHILVNTIDAARPTVVGEHKKVRCATGVLPRGATLT